MQSCLKMKIFCSRTILKTILDIFRLIVITSFFWYYRRLFQWLSSLSRIWSGHWRPHCGQRDDRHWLRRQLRRLRQRMHQPTGWPRLFSIWNVPSTTGSDAGQVQQRWLRRRVCGRRHPWIHVEPVSAHDDGVPNIPCKSGGIHSNDRKLKPKHTDSTELLLHRISEWVTQSKNQIYHVKPAYFQNRFEIFPQIHRAFHKHSIRC